MLPRFESTDEDDFADVGAITQIPNSGPVFVTAGSREVILCRDGSQIKAWSGNCTHNFARLSQGSVEGDLVICPMHGAKFNAKTGKSLSSLCKNLPAVELKIKGRRILVRRG